MLTSKYTVGQVLKMAAERLGARHRLAPIVTTNVELPLGNAQLVVELTNRNSRMYGSQLPLLDAADKLERVKLTSEQPIAGLEVDKVGIVVRDLGLMVAGVREKQRNDMADALGASFRIPYAPLPGSAVAVSGRVNNLVGRRRIIVEGPTAVVDIALGHKLRETVQSHEDSLREAARLEAHAKANKPSIQKQALASLSTWEFGQKHREQLAHFQTRIVGQHFRDEKSQDVLAGKRVGNMVLFVREPDNAVDSNAVMILAWSHDDKKWFHVGYVPADQASLVRSRWTVNPYDVAVGVITDIPPNADGHRKGPSIKVEFTGEIRTYPGFRG